MGRDVTPGRHTGCRECPSVFRRRKVESRVGNHTGRMVIGRAVAFDEGRRDRARPWGKGGAEASASPGAIRAAIAWGCGGGGIAARVERRSRRLAYGTVDRLRGPAPGRAGSVEYSVFLRKFTSDAIEKKSLGQPVSPPRRHCANMREPRG